MRSAVGWWFWLVFAKIKVGENSLQNFTITLHKLYTSFTKRLNTLKWAFKRLKWTQQNDFRHLTI